MKKILLTIIYPFWFFFSLTTIGRIIIGYTYFFIPPIIIYNKVNGGFEFIPITIILYPIILWFLVILYSFLKESYEEYNYKTD